MPRLLSRTVMSALLVGAGMVGSATPAGAAPAPGWRIVYRLPAGDYGPAVYGVAAVGARNAWAVGGQRIRRNDNVVEYRPFVLRWNGTRWARAGFPAAATGAYGGDLAGADASAATNVWTHGIASTPAGYASFTARWDGGRWRSYRLVTDSFINDLKATGKNNAWMVGAARGTPFFRRFDGKAWRNLPVPGHLQKISVVSATDIWGIGPLGGGKSIAHWNGRTWQKRTLPAVVPPTGLAGGGPVTMTTTAVHAFGPRNVWVTAGFRQSDWEVPGTVLLQWNGKTWRRVLRTPSDMVRDIAPDGTGGLWIAADRMRLEPRDCCDNYELILLGRDLVRIQNGHIVRRRGVPADPGLKTELLDLERIPGTTSLWAAGQQSKYPYDGIGGHTLLKFGR